MNNEMLPASFRDPAGFLFQRDGSLYRQVNQAGRADYDRFMISGLYQRLVSERLVIPHQEVDIPLARPDVCHKVLKPQQVPFISYPYEWGFSQYRDAALATLRIQQIALEYNQSLKDASAYNIQFFQSRPTLIDTLSFEEYAEGSPWVAYRQFCQHFLAPLSLMATRDVRLGQLMRIYIDGIPLDLASHLLPGRTRWISPLLLHIHLHAANQRKHSAGGAAPANLQFSRNAMIGLLESLDGGIQHLSRKFNQTEWGDYYDNTNYSEEGLLHKAALVEEFLDQVHPRTLWDLGANTGHFSRLASQRGIQTVAFDIDPLAVEKGYLASRAAGDEHLLNLLLDLTNPSPSLGWSNHERLSLLERGPVDAVMALALVHHLAISNNVPLKQLAEFFAGLGRWLIIEFIPKDDSQVQRLLATRKDIFPEYIPEEFEAAFGEKFYILRREPIQGSKRVLYLMERIRE